ncbi:MAG: hypothetical protein IPF77_17070, partial [Gemmatimonadetes bacterium]|nr:hypothetical protein [Gemmatimonadota bacterium]
VKELMLRTGGTAEETSRLIQTVDDAGISYETLSTAMRFAVKNGIEPNIQSIAKLSDEYLALNGPVERGQYLLDKFGRSGMDMARIMDMGGEAILNMSQAVEKNLIVTDDAIQASEEYRVNVDNLSDSFEGLKVMIGNEVIPVLNHFIKTMSEQNEVIEDGVIQTGRFGTQAGNAARSLELLDTGVGSATTSYTAWAQSLNITTSELGASDEAMKAMSATNMGLLSSVKTIQAATDSYEASLSTLTTETGILERQQAAMGTRTEANASEWDALSQKIWENNLQTQQLSRDNELAMKKIAADLYIAKLSADGLTDAEYDLAIQALITSGQIDKETAEMAKNFEQNLKPEIIRTKNEVVTLGNQAAALATDYFMNFVANLSVNYSGTGGGGGGQQNYGQEDADAEVVIPPESEVVINGKTFGSGGGGKGSGSAGGGITFNYSPVLSTMSRDEMQNILLPFIIEGIRQANLR